jgi:hypothetical protein
VSQAPEPLDDARYVAALHAAMLRHQREGSPASLDQAFAAAGAAVARLRGERAAAPPDVDEVRRLFELLPDFERLVAIAVGEAARAAAAAGARMWQWLRLAGPPPAWNEDELARARLLVACACAPLDVRGEQWLGPRLRRLAAGRWAELIVERLGGTDEQWWREALGERYESVRQRCAPRTSWRTRGLAVLAEADPRTRATLKARLERWLAAGGELERLPAELEASLVQSRTPPRVA